MEWIEIVLFMIASIGALLLGFEILSSNVTKLFHTQLKKLFNKTSNNDMIGVGIGASTTAIVQSSGATTVMIVGFVNTGIITLRQATAMIMGANIGTTITAQLAALSSFDFGAIALGLTGIGAFVTMLSKKERIKTIGNALTGFGLLFLALECMSIAIKNELVYGAIKNVLSSDVVSNGVGAPILLFVLGIILTALVQSSSLITTIVISLTAAGIYIGAGPNATQLTNNILFLILGTNIGSCVTALISSIGTTTNARRASLIHLLFNTFGSVIFMILLFLYKDFMVDTFGKWFLEPSTQIAMFHTFFNVICTVIFLPFIKGFVKISEKLVPEKEEAKQDGSELTFVDERLLATPSVAVHQVRREIGLMYFKAVKVLNKAIDGFTSKNVDVSEETEKLNEELQINNKLLIEFMVKLSNQNMVYEDECTLSVFHKVLNDVLRIGELGENVCKYTKFMVKHELEFSSIVMTQINDMKIAINNLYKKTDEIFLTKNMKFLKDAESLENQVDMLRKQLIDDHFDRLNRGECKPQNSGVFVSLVNNLERSADHMLFVAFSVKEANDQFLANEN